MPIFFPHKFAKLKELHIFFKSSELVANPSITSCGFQLLDILF